MSEVGAERSSLAKRQVVCQFTRSNYIPVIKNLDEKELGTLLELLTVSGLLFSRTQVPL